MLPSSPVPLSPLLIYHLLKANWQLLQCRSKKLQILHSLNSSSKLLTATGSIMLALHRHLWRCAVKVNCKSSTRNWEMGTATLGILQSQIELRSYYSYWGTSVAPVPWQKQAVMLLRGSVLCSLWGSGVFLGNQAMPTRGNSENPETLTATTDSEKNIYRNNWKDKQKTECAWRILINTCTQRLST